MSEKIRGWEKAYDAVLKLGRPSTVREITDQIHLAWPDHKSSNVSPDLSMITVNSYSRGHYQAHAQPRRIAVTSG